MKIIKLAITGKMGTGKSSVTKIIEMELTGAYVSSYSRVIRETLTRLDLKPTRELMQATGDFFRKYDEHVWTNKLLKETMGLGKPIIIEGTRYVFEAEKLRSEGFKIIKIEAPDNLRRKRIEEREKRNISNVEWIKWQKHGTEIYVDQIKADFILDNSDSYQKLNEKIKLILNQLKREE